ncbi:MAG: energy transducer TonB, partial [Bacteroidota bacterium]
MKKFSFLLLFVCLSFQYVTAQNIDSIEVKTPTNKTPQRVVPPPPPKEEIIFRVVEDLPRFPGCEVEDSKTKMKKCSKDKVQEFIQERIKYPIKAKENGIEGLCLVSFRVKKNGKIDEVALVKDIGGNCGQEALRVINLMIAETPYWI